MKNFIVSRPLDPQNEKKLHGQKKDISTFRQLEQENNSETTKKNIKLPTNSKALFLFSALITQLIIKSDASL